MGTINSQKLPCLNYKALTLPNAKLRRIGGFFVLLHVLILFLMMEIRNIALFAAGDDRLKICMDMSSTVNLKESSLRRLSAGAKWGLRSSLEADDIQLAVIESAAVHTVVVLFLCRVILGLLFRKICFLQFSFKVMLFS